MGGAAGAGPALLYASTTQLPHNDLDDFLTQEPAPTPQDLLDHVYAYSEPVALDVATVKARIHAVLANGELEPNAKEIAAMDILIADLRQRTKIYHAGGRAVIVRPETSVPSTLMAVPKGSSPFLSLVSEYGISTKAMG